MSAMRIVLINLDRSTDRLASFRASNPHVVCERMPAVDGGALDRAALVADGTIAADLAYTAGAIGNALSHRRVWQQAVATAAPITVLEDDAALCANFVAEATRVIGTLGADWDYIQWGWNFDTVLMFALLPGISPSVALFDQDAMRRALPQFHARDVETRAFRLQRSLGIPAYTISPQGAAKLLSVSEPLRQLQVSFPVIGVFANLSIDYVMSAYYERMNAFVAFPPLVLTANDHGISTVQPKPGGTPI